VAAEGALILAERNSALSPLVLAGKAPNHKNRKRNSFPEAEQGSFRSLCSHRRLHSRSLA
jgi:hypothetical protein